MDMKVSIDAMTADEFRELAKHISTYISLRGCMDEECIKKRFKRKNSKRLNNLHPNRYARRIITESWLNPHPTYQEILGMNDEEYANWIKW